MEKMRNSIQKKIQKIREKRKARGRITEGRETNQKESVIRENN